MSIEKLIIPVALAIFAIFALIFYPYKDEKTARRALESAGYYGIQFSEARFTGCGRWEGLYRTGFSARGASGQRVTGVVCSGLFFPGAVIRTD